MFTLPKASSAVSVCWRCRCRLQQRLRGQTAAFSTSRARRATQTHSSTNYSPAEQTSPAPPLIQDASPKTDIDLDVDVDFDVDADLEAYDGLDRPSRPLVWKRLDLNQQIDLGLPSLGLPAAIRVLKETPERRPKDSHQAENKINPDELHNLTAGLLEEHDKDDAVRYNEHIEELRRRLPDPRELGPGPPLYLCREIATQLVNGFTSQQLRDYRRQADPSRLASVDNLTATYACDLYSRTRWYPGGSAFPSEALVRLRAEPSARGCEKPLLDFSQAGTRKVPRGGRKAAVVDSIIRECWAIRPQEEQTGIGEVDLQIQPLIMAVMTKHHESIFGRLSNDYRADFRTSRGHSLVRIKAEYNVMRNLVLELEAAMRDVVDETVEFAVPMDKRPNKAARETFDNFISSGYLRQIERLTKTVIRALEPGAGDLVVKLRVYYLGPDRTAVDDVRRLLKQTLDLPVSRSLLQSTPRLSEISPQYVEVEGDTMLPMQHRRKKWYRLRHKPSASEKPIQDLDDPLWVVYSPAPTLALSRKTCEHLTGAWNDIPTIEPSAEPPALWDTEVRRTFSSVVGALVHLPEPHLHLAGKSKSSPAAKQPTPLSARRRVLIPRTPELWRTLPELVKGSPAIRNELYIQLHPDRVFGSTDAPSIALLPTLELYVDLETLRQRASLREARLVRDMRMADLMIPQYAADLRCTGTASFSSMAATDSSLTAFIDQSSLDIWGGAPLQTPSRLRLSIPRFACRLPEAHSRASHSRADAKSSGNAGSGNTTGILASQSQLEVEYVFARLEHRSTMRMLYQGYPLLYTTIEGGRAGGRRSELRLESEGIKLTNDADRGHAKDLFSNFLGFALELVMRVPV